MDRKGPCGQRRRRRGMRLLLRPSLLLMLAETASHGYELYDQLDRLGFDPNCLDPSIVYRELREMEELERRNTTRKNEANARRKRTWAEKRIKEAFESTPS